MNTNTVSPATATARPSADEVQSALAALERLCQLPPLGRQQVLEHVDPAFVRALAGTVDTVVAHWQDQRDESASELNQENGSDDPDSDDSDGDSDGDSESSKSSKKSPKKPSKKPPKKRKRTAPADKDDNFSVVYDRLCRGVRSLLALRNRNAVTLSLFAAASAKIVRSTSVDAVHAVLVSHDRAVRGSQVNCYQQRLSQAMAFSALSRWVEAHREAYPRGVKQFVESARFAGVIGCGYSAFKKHVEWAKLALRFRCFFLLDVPPSLVVNNVARLRTFIEQDTARVAFWSQFAPGDDVTRAPVSTIACEFEHGGGVIQTFSVTAVGDQHPPPSGVDPAAWTQLISEAHHRNVDAATLVGRVREVANQASRGVGAGGVGRTVSPSDAVAALHHANLDVQGALAHLRDRTTAMDVAN